MCGTSPRRPTWHGARLQLLRLRLGRLLWLLLLLPLLLLLQLLARLLLSTFIKVLLQGGKGAGEHIRLQQAQLLYGVGAWCRGRASSLVLLLLWRWWRLPGLLWAGRRAVVRYSLQLALALPISLCILLGV